MNESSDGVHWSNEDEVLLRSLGLWDDATTGQLVVRDRVLRGAYFGSIWLEEPIFDGVTFEECGLGYNLPGASFLRGSAVGSFFGKTELQGGTIEDFEFADSHFQSTEFRGARLKSVVFRNCNMLKTFFIQASLSNVVFENCTFDRTFFERSSLERVRFESPVVRGKIFADDAVCIDESTAAELGQLVDLGDSVTD